MEFARLLGRDDLKAFLKEFSLEKPTEVQKKAIPLFLDNKDLLVLAPTGTGKTLAFALPLFALLKKEEEQGGVREKKKGCPRAIVLSPTRELAHQLFKVFKDISHFSKLRVRLLAGGEAKDKERALYSQEYEILISAPGKLGQLIREEKISLEEVKHLILDEADQLLDMGFKKDIETIYGDCGKSAPQVILFSATLSPRYEEFISTVFGAVKFQRVELTGSNALRPTIETYNVYVQEKDKNDMCCTFLRRKARGDGLIFVNKKENAEELFKFLSKEFPDKIFHVLHGAMEAKDRKVNYTELLEKGGILICTDIVARGLDLKGLAWVLNYDLPFEAVYYIHRSGRTGRQGKPGVVFNLVTPRDEVLIGRINEAIRGQTALKLKNIPILKNEQRNESPEKVIRRKKMERTRIKKAPRRDRLKSAKKSVGKKTTTRTERTSTKRPQRNVKGKR